MPPVVQEGAAGAPAVAGAPSVLLPNHIICGFKPEPQFGIRFT
jgi:hypothetical protein